MCGGSEGLPCIDATNQGDRHVPETNHPGREPEPPGKPFHAAFARETPAAGKALPLDRGAALALVCVPPGAHLVRPARLCLGLDRAHTPLVPCMREAMLRAGALDQARKWAELERELDAEVQP